MAETVVVSGGSASTEKALLCFLIALILFLVGLFTLILWICLWPAAAVFVILGIMHLLED